MSDEQPFDVVSWGKAYIEGRLTVPEVDELKRNVSVEQWLRLVNSRKVFLISAKQENTLKDVCMLLAMILAKLP